MAFHHGTETLRVDGGSSPVYDIDGAIVAIVGTAPIGAVNELTVCQTAKDFAQFSTLTGAGFTLPDAAAIFTRYQAGKAYVINVLDPATHKSRATDEALSIDAVTLKARTAHPALLPGYSLSDSSGALAENTDYTINTMTGEITFTALKTGVKITYDYADPSKVTEADILGAYVAATGRRTGLELVQEGFTRFGADAKVLIVPKYDATATCAAAMIATAEKMSAEAYIDAPIGTSLSKALQGRGSAGTINFQGASRAANLFFPHVQNGTSLESLATHAAALRMLVDVQQGFWWSTSNHELRGVTGVEIALTSRADDLQSETNQLNAVGITTVFNSFGSGYRLWGNRNASWPASSHISNFAVAWRTGNFIDEAIRRAECKYIDRPIDKPLLDTFLEDIRVYLAGSQAIVGFSVDLDHDYDLADAFSKGQVPLVYDYTPKLPAERITNTSVMTRKYLANLIS